jgi:hypothetical protein
MIDSLYNRDLPHVSFCLPHIPHEEMQAEALRWLENDLQLTGSIYGVEDYHMQVLTDEVVFNLRSCHCHE